MLEVEFSLSPASGAAATMHCSPPKAVANAHIDAGNRTELNSRLRYSCKPGYKRKAGTSSLIQCVLWNGSQPRWTEPTLQCILSIRSVASSV
ncbi:hypothetical protein EK904_008660, partial [Melospiza melodia maxima]